MFMNLTHMESCAMHPVVTRFSHLCGCVGAIYSFSLLCGIPHMAAPEVTDPFWRRWVFMCLVFRACPQATVTFCTCLLGHTCKASSIANSRSGTADL